MPIFTQIHKRDGSLAPFQASKITNAVAKAMQAANEFDSAVTPTLFIGDAAQRVTEQVLKALVGHISTSSWSNTRNGVPNIEDIQDIVEQQLILMDYAKTAKAYILYRHKRKEIREQNFQIPDHVKVLVADSKQYFKGTLSELVFYRSYARWIEEEGRRETWIETVQRYMDYMKEILGNKLNQEEYAVIHGAILRQEVMPSMRLLQFAGVAARATNACAFNCSYLAINSIRSFGELLYLCMCGVGVGYSVESKYVGQLPQIQRQRKQKPNWFAVPDTREGWCDAFIYGLTNWFQGTDIEFDLSQLRPAGARLKTMGGRSSGPEPLRRLLAFTRSKILAKQGKRLSNLDVHDICCMTGEIAVAGGVRRTALLSLSDLDDIEMRDCKQGAFYTTEPHRMMANNSAVYEEKPSAKKFLEEFLALIKSGTGERGLFNRGSLNKQLTERRIQLLGDRIWGMGVNPCGEIDLISEEFCNLSEAVARAGDTSESLLRKIRIATIIGTYQSMLTDFPYLNPQWKENCDEERLLGVSITGQWDSVNAQQWLVLQAMHTVATSTNELYAERFGINRSTCVTCVKPSGTVSQLVDASSGMHPRYAPYYIRRIRISAEDPLFHMLKDQKFPYYPETGQQMGAASTYVLEFPVKSPDGAVTRNDLTALQQLEHWKMVKTEYTDHNPSVTILIGEEEWIEVANWLYNNWEILGGLSFLPRDDHAYLLAPYEEITKERYEEMVARTPQIDFSQILIYEKEDERDLRRELACAGGTCEL